MTLTLVLVALGAMVLAVVLYRFLMGGIKTTLEDLDTIHFDPDEVHIQENEVRFLESGEGPSWVGDGSLVLANDGLHAFLFEPRSRLFVQTHELIRFDIKPVEGGAKAESYVLQVEFMDEGSSSTLVCRIKQGDHWEKELDRVIQESN